MPNSGFIKIFLTIVISIILTLIIVFSYFVASPEDIVKFGRLLPSKPELIILPLSQFDKNLKSSSLIYVFKDTTIKEVRNLSAGKELITDVNGPNIPKFVTSDLTKITVTGAISSGKPTIENLIPGRKVQVTANYSPVHNTWFISEILVYPEP